MSQEVGGGHVFYAFRWTRPLLLGALLPLSLAVIGRGRWLLWILIAGALVQSVQMIGDGTRPGQTEAATIVRQYADDGDAYAVLPAAFYGDPLQYYLAGGKPQSLITQMRAGKLKIGEKTIYGPLMERQLPF
jgi:hypothetical protein